MSIEDATEEELRAILGYLAERTGGDRPPVLVGGWAVFAYNAYSKSKDIDLVLSSQHRASLLQWLRSERGYQVKRGAEPGWRGASKRLPGVGPIIVDVGGFEEEYAFDGRSERLDFDLALEHNAERRVAGGLVHVPTRGLLLLYKAKAAWDRANRLARGASPEPEWEPGKLVKDRADLLALLDPRIKEAWDLGFLQAQLRRCPFLLGTLEAAALDRDARARYRGVDERTATAWVGQLLEHLDLV